MSLIESVTKTVLDNGLTVLVKENHSTPVVAIFTYVKAGYFNESDRLTGISHLIEHMFFKGTSKRGVGQIAVDTKELGGYLNASTIYDHTLYYTVLPSNQFSRGLDIQADALMNSVFDPDELKKETEVVIQEAKRKLDMPASVASEKLFELAFEKHRLRRWRIGTEDGLRSFSRDDFLTFYKNLYRPENIILAVVGDISTTEAIAEVEKCYGNFDPGILIKAESEPEPVQTRFKYRFLSGDIQQSYLRIGFHTPGIFHGDTYALEMLAFILGHGRSSRLFQNIKEKKTLVNAISTYNYSLKDLGIFLIDATASAEKLRDAEAEVFNELAHLQHMPVTNPELARARSLLESMVAFSIESVSGQANLLASYEALGDYNLIEEYLHKLYAVDEADIARVTQKYLTPPNCSLLEYVPKKSNLTAGNVSQFESEYAGKLAQKKPASFSINQEETEAPVFDLITSNDGKGKNIARFVLSNGLTLLVKEDHQTPLVSAGVFAKGGRNMENAENAGITRLAVRNALKGTQNRTAAEVALGIENLGSDISCSHDADYWGFSMNILAKNFEAGWEILSDVILNPTFPAEELAKEKETTLAAISQTKDDMFRFPLQLFYAALFENNAYGLSPYGTPETLAALSAQNLSQWYFNYICPENLTVVVVGDVDVEKMRDGVEQTFGSQMPRSQIKFGNEVSGIKFGSKVNEVKFGNEINVETRDKEQTGIVLGFPGPDFNDRDTYPLIVLQNILSGLGGRFFEELRSRQSLAYTVSTYLVSRLHAGAFLAYIATSPDKEEIAREGLLKEFGKLLKEPVSEKELDQAIKFTVGTHRIGLETYRAQMAQYAYNELLGKGVEEVEAFPEKIEKVTVEHIFQATRKYIDLENYAQGIVRGRAS